MTKSCNMNYELNQVIAKEKHQAAKNAKNRERESMILRIIPIVSLIVVIVFSCVGISLGVLAAYGGNLP